VANPEHLKILCQGVDRWNEWRKENPHISPNISSSDLSQKKLSFINFSHVSLQGCSLRETDLSNANLSYANLSHAYLSKTNFQEANLGKANLNGVSFSGSNFNQARFFRANLRNSSLLGLYLAEFDLREADLRGADLEDADLEGADLRGANLSGINLGILWASKSDLRGAKLIGAKISKYSEHINEFDFSHANLSYADLSGADFRWINLSGTNLRGANLSNINLSNANLSGTVLSEANLGNANLNGVNLNHKDLRHVNLAGVNLKDTSLEKANLYCANLSNVNLNGVNLQDAKLQKANLQNSNLCASQVLGTDFSTAILTGSCIADWQISSSTKLNDVTCDYIYRAIDKDGQFSGRLPVDPNSTFSPGEFELWASVRASALETIDLTFTEGFNWQDFFNSLQEVRSQNPDTGIFLQGVEERDGQYVVRLRIETDKTGKDRIILEANIETTTKELLETKRRLHEAHGEIKALDRSLEKALRMATDQGPKYNLQGAQFAGGFAETVQGDQTGGIINNYGQDTKDIIRLLTSLREQAQDFPTEHKEEALDLLNDLEIDLKKPEPNTNRMGRKLKRFAEIATTIGILTAGAVTFSGNLNEVVGNVIELTETLGIPIEKVQPSQISPEDITY
jgi:uncharacterized protein YjbI with pentapeptide repeats